MRIRCTSRRRLTIPLLLIIGAIIFGVTAAPVFAQRDQSVRITSSFDRDWRFLKDDALGAESTDFKDAAWPKLDVPHDWSIEGPVDEQNPTGQGGGFVPSGIGWYRKHFTVASEPRDRLGFS